MKMLNAVFFVLIVFCLVGCIGLYGLNDQRELSNEYIIEQSKQEGITKPTIQGNSFRASVIKEMYDDSLLAKDVQQPLQFWLINDNNVVCNIVNCYANGFPNLKWKLDNVYQHKLKYTRPISPSTSTQKIKSVFSIEDNNSDTMAIVAYSLFMGRQNERFLNEVKQFLSRHEKIKTVFVNMDNTFDSN